MNDLVRIIPMTEEQIQQEVLKSWQTAIPGLKQATSLNSLRSTLCRAFKETMNNHPIVEVRSWNHSGLPNLVCLVPGVYPKKYIEKMFES